MVILRVFLGYYYRNMNYSLFVKVGGCCILINYDIFVNIIEVF